MQLFDPSGQILKLLFSDAVFVIVPGLHIGFLKQLEQALFFVGFLGKNFHELRIDAGDSFGEISEMMSFRFVAGKDKKNSVVCMLGSLVELESSKITISISNSILKMSEESRCLLKSRLKMPLRCCFQLLRTESPGSGELAIAGVV